MGKIADKRGRYAHNQERRRRLIADGVEWWRVTAASDDNLSTLEAEAMARHFDVVPDVACVEDLAPNLAWHKPAVTDETPDEAESTRYFRARVMAGEGVVIPLRSFSLLGGDDYHGGAA